MSRGSRFYNPQFDLFLPSIVDLKFRDQKDTMERPFFSLSKSKRMKPIEYVNENDGIFVTVQPHQDYGMATIWDADILIWAASVLWPPPVFCHSYKKSQPGQVRGPRC